MTVNRGSWYAFASMALILLAGFYLRYESVFETTVYRHIRSDATNYFMYAYNLRLKHTYSREVGKTRGSGLPSEARGGPFSGLSPVSGPLCGRSWKKIQE